MVINQEDALALEQRLMRLLDKLEHHSEELRKNIDVRFAQIERSLNEGSLEFVRFQGKVDQHIKDSELEISHINQDRIANSANKVKIRLAMIGAFVSIVTVLISALATYLGK